MRTLIKVRSKNDRFRRGGLAFTRDPRELDVETLTEEQIDGIKRGVEEGMLLVVETTRRPLPQVDTSDHLTDPLSTARAIWFAISRGLTLGEETKTDVTDPGHTHTIGEETKTASDHLPQSGVSAAAVVAPAPEANQAPASADTADKPKTNRRK